jgi:acyl-CoA oxidase
MVLLQKKNEWRCRFCKTLPPVDLRAKDPLRLKILEQVKLLADQGFGAYAFPDAYGGKGSPGGSSALFEGMAYGNLSLLIKFGVQFGLFGGAVYLLGTEKHHRKYLMDTGLGQLLGCFAMTETGHGSNVKDLETTATYNADTGGLVVNSPTKKSGKEYIGNALHASMAAVFVQLIVHGQNHGIHAVLVPLRDQYGQLLPGISIEDCGYKMGLNGVDNGRIWFNNVHVPLENLLNKYGGIEPNGTYASPIEKPSKRFFTMLGALVGGRVSIAAGSNSAAKKSLAIAIKYALIRRQFAAVDGAEETLIMDYPTHQERLIPLLAKSYALSFAIEDLRAMFAAAYQSEDKREVETLAAGLKSYASWHATKTIQTSRETCGGKGYLAENQFADLKGDTEIFTTFEGDNTVLMQLVAKAVLTDFKQDFNEGGFPAIYRHILKRMANNWATQNPFATQNVSAEHLLDQNFMADALAFRQERLLFSLSDRMRSFMSKKLDPNDIFMRVQTHMVALAHAHIEQAIFKSFVSKLNEMPDSPEKEALLVLQQTFALDAIYTDRGWFLENEFLSAEKSKAIRKVLSHLLGKIRSSIGLYVDAFDIPDALLNAQILKSSKEAVY